MAAVLCEVVVVTGVTAAPIATTTTTPWRREKRPFTIFLARWSLAAKGSPSEDVLASGTSLLLGLLRYLGNV